MQISFNLLTRKLYVKANYVLEETEYFVFPSIYDVFGFKETSINDLETAATVWCKHMNSTNTPGHPPGHKIGSYDASLSYVCSCSVFIIIWLQRQHVDKDKNSP